VTKTPHIDQVATLGVVEASMTLKQFCGAEQMCPGSYFKMRAKGLAPVEIRVPGTRIIRITAESRREWHRMLAALAQSREARLEAERQRAQSVKAGKAAAASPRHVNATGRRKAQRGAP
jgi:hypothetical protein